MKRPVSLEEAAPPRREARPAADAPPGIPLHQMEPGSGLQLPDVAPRRAIGHADLGDRFVDRPQAVDEFEQLGSPLAKLRPGAKDHPNFDLGLHRSPQDFAIMTSVALMMARGRALAAPASVLP